MIRIDLMPAQQGDCLWIEYGDARRPYRVLIDGGTPFTYGILKERIESLPKEDRRFELLIITHIDSDHIGGVVGLLKNPPSGLTLGDVWFNSFQHLPSRSKTLGVRQAEEVTKELESGRFPWNDEFDNGAIHVSNSGSLKEVRLIDGMKLTLLSPYLRQLEMLQPKWDEELKLLKKKEEERIRVRAHGTTLSVPPDVVTLAGSSFKDDIAAANGSSIALLAEYDGKALLLTGDAFAGVLVKSIRRLLSMRKIKRLRLDGFKLSHHCSKANTSTDLLSLVECRNYLISTNGSTYNHPDVEAMARVLEFGGDRKLLHFNYKTTQTEIWNNRGLKHRYGYGTRYADEKKSLTLVLR